MTELNAIPVGSVPIFARKAFPPVSSMTRAMEETWEIDSIANSARVSPSSITLAVRCDDGDAEQRPVG